MLSKVIVSIVIGLTSALVSSTSWAERLVIGAYNVENLFDANDDLGNPRDDTYLPLALKTARGEAHREACEENNSPGSRYFKECMELDWSEDVLSAKLKNIAEVIKSIDGGNGPDVLTLQEVEDVAIVEMLNKDYLGGMGYSVAGFDSSDEPTSRGIDVMMLSRLPVKSSRAHRIDFGSNANSCKATRDILEVVLELPDGAELVAFGVHFPSPSNDNLCRTVAAKKLLELRDQAIPSLQSNRVAVAMGDFNITCSEEARSVLRQDILPNWLVPLGVGLSAALPNGLSTSEQDIIQTTQQDLRCGPPGSHFYNGTWSFLDLIVGSKNLRGSFHNGPNWFLNLGSFRTGIYTDDQIFINSLNQTSPNYFDPRTKRGTSDHWPVLIDLLSR